jgi:hypothetical protein
MEEVVVEADVDSRHPSQPWREVVEKVVKKVVKKEVSR